MSSARDEEVVKSALPYIRSIVALCIFLRVPATGVEGSYKAADRFIAQMKEDMR